jgi:hypothetical protein
VPHYYLHLYNDLVVADEEGFDFRDLEAARAGAIENIRGLICETVRRGCINLSHRIDIADEHGDVLASVKFGEAVRVDG